jgi:hypothetical protein
MSFWENKVWHHLVHKKLGEVLFYYLVRVRPFNLKSTIANLEQLFKEKRLGSIRVFLIFGPYDLLIRAWLHPSIEPEFREWLEKSLEQTRSIHPFAVQSVKKEYSARGLANIDHTLLELIDRKTVQRIQDNEDAELLQKFINGGLVYEREHRTPSNAKFFVAIKVEDETHGLQSDVAKGINNYCSQNRELLMFPSIYKGWGFCSVLVKAQVNDYFNVADLPNWIGDNYADLGVSTETYLVHGRSHIVGDELIGEATFAAIKGKSLFIQSIIPEIYDEQFEGSAKIERFLKDLEEKTEWYQLTQQDKNLLHDYLIGLLRDDTIKMAETLFIYFFSLEKFLRENHNQFTKRIIDRPENIKAIYDEVNQSRAGKQLTLGDLLRVYRKGLEYSEYKERAAILDNWQDLALIRNKVAHGDIDLLTNWEEIISRMLKHLLNVHELVSLIEEVTENRYTGHY